MPILELRDLDAGDASVIRGWLRDYLAQHRRWWSEAYGVPPRIDLDDLVKEDWEELLRSAATPEAFVRVLGGDAPAGIVRARLRTDGFMGIKLAVLSWIYVAEAARGAGSATRLMEAFHAWAQSHEVDGYEVYVTAANSAAIRLYQRNGFHIADHRMLH